jgi:hypothetical protein
MVSRILNDTNKDELPAAIRNKSQRQVESLVVAAKPATRVRDRIKPVLVPVSEPPAAALDQPSTRDHPSALDRPETDRPTPAVGALTRPLSQPLSQTVWITPAAGAAAGVTEGVV